MLGQSLEGSSRSDCTWTGTFSAPNDNKASTGYAEADPPFVVGRAMLALDSGSSEHVYPLNGGGDWLSEPIIATIGAIVLIVWTGFSVWLLRRRRARRRADDTFVLT